MTLLLVRTPKGAETWVAYEDLAQENLYVYVPNTGRFHLNDPLSVDYYVDQELSYQPITPAEAAAAIKAGVVGRIDERRKGFLVDQFRADDPSRTLTVEKALGAAAPTQLSPRQRALQRARQRADLIDHAAPGAWVTYQTYDRAHRQRALVAANDLRQGGAKIKALARLGPLEARLVDQPDHVLVLVRRAIPAAKTVNKRDAT